MKFVQLAKNLKEEGLKPVYVVEGAEAYFRDRAVASIRDACALTQPALNDVRYEGEAMRGERLAALPAELFTLPFFDEKRLVRIYEFYPSEREWESALGAYAEKPCETTVLVIVNTGRKKAADLKKKRGVVYVDCAKESEEMLSRWLFGSAKRAGLSIEGDAVSRMVRYCNFDAARMQLELKKLGQLLGDGGTITRATVEEYVAKDVEYKTFELTQAASGGNKSAFFEILHDLNEKGFDENAALAALVSHFRALAEIAGMRGSDADVGKALGLHPYVVKKDREVLARMGKERASALYLKLYAFAADMRSGKYSKSGALAGAVAEIFYG